ncbi:NKG2D ligand 4 [Anopheles sinensis]|uniref:NKG2D ligand 4 n=1 Tax=Anopheles sinensis TaxID=74873 RepID=A0A084WLG8_ANOSI|nr:NKG2D ligand 4 [Anopheles sinensis]
MSGQGSQSALKFPSIAFRPSPTTAPMTKRPCFPSGNLSRRDLRVGTAPDRQIEINALGPSNRNHYCIAHCNKWCIFVAHRGRWSDGRGGGERHGSGWRPPDRDTTGLRGQEIVGERSSAEKNAEASTVAATAQAGDNVKHNCIKTTNPTMDAPTELARTGVQHKAK